MGRDAPSSTVLLRRDPSTAREASPAALAPLAPRRTGSVSRAAAWTVLGYVALISCRFAFNLLLTRLVAPKVFGVMAIVNLLILSLHMFSDLGIGQCVTRHDRGDDPRFLNTAWTLQVLRGLVLWILAVALAGPAAWFYGEPALAWLIPIAGATAAFDGLQSTAIFTLNRRLSRGRLVLWELLPYVAVMIVAVGIIASMGYRNDGGADDSGMQDAQVCVLVIANVIIFAIRAAASYRLFAGRRHRFTLEPAAARELLHFGGWVFVSTACGFLAAQADQIVIGKMSLETLGVYRVASQLAALPAQFIATLCAQLAFPLYSRLVREDGDYGIASVHRKVGIVAGWLVSGLLVAGPTFVECVYRGQYRDAADYVQLLAAAVWFTMLQCSGEAILLAHGRARLMAIGQIVKLAALAPLLIYGYKWRGLTGLVVGYGVAEAVRYVVFAVALRSLGQRFVRIDLGLTLLVGATAGGSLWLGPLAWGGASPWVRLGLEALAVTAVWAAAYGALRGRSFFSPPLRGRVRVGGQ
jgi:O-antigen/teichoic acid export membrane protein